MSKKSFDSNIEWKLMVSLILLICVKVLLIPAYHSTDFEVHRNWLAITHSLPLKEWYFDETSQWTLDYPPFFAYFEWIISQFAWIFDKKMLEVHNLNYASNETVYFQRSTVIITDVLYIIAAWRLTSNIPNKEQRIHTFILAVFNIALLFVDHIHFQYNGFLMGILLLCIILAQKKRFLGLALAFSVLVLMKHLFVPLAPIFALYLLKSYCMNSKNFSEFNKNLFLTRLFYLVLIALSVLILGFGPFLAQENGFNQIQQMLTRLFPFGRGLVHAYWAPNIWAIYCFMDKVLVFVVKKLQLMDFENAAELNNLSTAGLVGDFHFFIFPKISASICLLLVFLSSLPGIRLVFVKNSWENLLRAVVYGSLCSFMFGYHVHEKAIMIPMVLQTFLIAHSPLDTLVFYILTIVGNVSLFPLLFEVPELMIKVMLLLSYLLFCWRNQPIKTSLPIWMKRLLVFCCIHMIILVIFTELVHPVWFKSRGEIILPFLPLLLTSVSCSFYIITAWVLVLWYCIV